MSSKKYILSLAGISFLLLTLVALLNFSVDPLAKFRASDHIYYSSERELKPRLAKKSHYDGLIIGNSKVTYIQTDDLSRHGKILNAGFSAAAIEEIRYFLEEADPKVKWVGIGLDFTMFSTSPPYKTRIVKYFNNIPVFDQLEYLVSVDTFRYSAKSLSKYIRGVRQRYTPLGARNKKHRVKKDRTKLSAYEKSIGKMRKTGFLNFKYSTQRMNDLKKIKQWADRKGIILVAWINPHEKEVWKIVRERVGANVELLLAEINKTLPNFVDLSKQYQNSANFWKEHPIHYYPSTGEKFFSKEVFPMIEAAHKPF